MKHLIPCGLAAFALFHLNLQATGQPLMVSNNHTPQQLVENFLIGPDVQVSNIQFTGSAQARGYFDGSTSNIGLHSGVIVSTGAVTDAVGPNDSIPETDVGTDFMLQGNSTLTSIMGFQTYDAAILEFDFQMPSDTFYLRYVFASNEYMLYVGSNVNDAFALLLSGPGIDGEQNLALIPGTQIPVAIDNVNANVNAQYYVDNQVPLGATVAYNGFTQPFTAQANIVPNEWYHIRMAIADGGDGLYDSAIFLLQHSFRGSLIGMNVDSDNLAISHSIYPNPFTESTTLIYENRAQKSATLTLTTLAGQLVRTISTTTGELRIDRGGLSSGIYFYQLRTDDGREATGKVVVD